MSPPGPDDASFCIDLSAATHERAGLGRYATALAEAILARGVQLTTFVNDPRESHLRPPLSDLPIHTAGLPRKRWRIRAAASYFGGPSLDRAFPGVGLFHATEHLLPKLTRARSVFTLHDTAYLLFPEYHLPRNRIYLRTMMPRFLRRADRIIAVSENTRRDALRLYPLDPDKIQVIPEGVEPSFRPDVEPGVVAGVRDRYGLPARFILTVGTIEPRKNYPTLVEAYASLRARHSEVGLVIAGGRGWLFERFFEQVRSLGLDDHVVFTGHVPDDDMPALLNAAEVFAFPSEFEGFGLPPLEAMACGIPVVCSNAASLPEVVGEAGVLLPPRDVGGWVGALDRLLADAPLRAGFGARGLARARRFSWDAAAERTIEVYRSVLSSPRR
ncbi:MAG: glycosyltransferase family 4 protein [Actinomycetota bacterium]